MREIQKREVDRKTDKGEYYKLSNTCRTYTGHGSPLTSSTAIATFQGDSNSYNEDYMSGRDVAAIFLRCTVHSGYKYVLQKCGQPIKIMDENENYFFFAGGLEDNDFRTILIENGHLTINNCTRIYN